MVDIQELVDNINSLLGSKVVSVIKVGDNFLVKEIRNSISPSMTIYTYSEVTKYLGDKRNVLARSIEDKIKSSLDDRALKSC